MNIAAEVVDDEYGISVFRFFKIRKNFADFINIDSKFQVN